MVFGRIIEQNTRVAEFSIPLIKSINNACLFARQSSKRAEAYQQDNVTIGLCNFKLNFLELMLHVHVL